MKTLLKKIFIIHGYCELITDYLKNDLLSEGYFYEENIFEYSIRDLITVIKHSSRIHNNNLIICYPITLKSLLVLLLILFIRPRKLIYVVPPSSKHILNNIFFRIRKYLVKTIFTLISIAGVKQLLVFTTPYERILLENIVKRSVFIYYPTYSIDKHVYSEVISYEKTTILFFIEKLNDLFLINETISVLEELGLKPLVLICLLNKNIVNCINDYRVVCIHSYEFDELIKYSTIIVAKTPSPVSNSIILKSIFYGKPVITTFEHGLAIYYSDTSFIYIQRSWTSESLASNILNILSDIDYLKKKSLSISLSSLNNRYGKYVILKFLTGEI